MTLDKLGKGRPAKVVAVDGSDASMEAKLREIGFAEDDRVSIVHLGPFGKKPICVRLNETLIALRVAEAAIIHVEPIA